MKCHFFSGGKAYQLLKKEFKHVYPVDTRRMVRKRSGIDHLSFTHQHPVSTAILRQRKRQVRNQKLKRHGNHAPLLRPAENTFTKIKPELLIADGDMHALRLAERWYIPAVYITNVVRPSYRLFAHAESGERFTERYVKKLQPNSYSRQPTTVHGLRLQSW